MIRPLANNAVLAAKGTRILRLAAIASVSWLAFAASAVAEDNCPAVPRERVADFLPRPADGEAEDKKLPHNVLARSGIAEALLDAGRFRETRAFLDALYKGAGAGMPPRALLSYVKAYRLQASDLFPTGLAGASDVNAMRFACLEKAVDLLDSALSRYKRVLGTRKKETAKPAEDATREAEAEAGFDPDEEPTGEEALAVIGALSLERAQVALQLGDERYRRAPPLRLGPPPKAGSNERDALSYYRAARHYLAQAEAARPASGADDRRLQDRATLAAKLDDRYAWYRNGEAFDGKALLKDVPDLGLEEDIAGLAITASVVAALEALEKSEEALNDRLNAAHDKIVASVQGLRESYASQGKFEAEMRSALFRELATIESRSGTHDKALIQAMREHELEINDLRRRVAKDRDELETQRDNARKDAGEGLRRMVDALNKLASIAPYTDDDSPLRGIWEEIANAAKTEEEERARAAKTARVGYTDERMIMPASPEGLAAYAKAALGDAADRVQLEYMATAAMAFDGESSLWNEKTSDMKNLKSTLEDLKSERKQAERNRAIEVFETRGRDIELKFEDLTEIAEDKFDVMLAAADAARQDPPSLAAELEKRRDELINQAVSFVKGEIAAVEAQIANAKGVIDAVEKGAKDVQDAITAAQGVYTAMQAIPSGTGLVVIQDRASMVALQESASKLLDTALQAKQGVYAIKQQVERFEKELRGYRQRLDQLSLEALEQEFAAARQQTIEEFVADVEMLKVDRLTELKEARTQLEDLSKIEQLIDEQRDEIYGEALVDIDRRIVRYREKRRSAEAERNDLAVKMRAGLIDIWRIGREVADATARADQFDNQIAAYNDRQDKQIEKKNKAYKALVASIEESRDLQRSRAAQILSQLGEDGTNVLERNASFGVDFSLERDAILDALDSPAGLDTDLDKLKEDFKDKREAVNKLLFDYANALTVLTQDLAVLSMAGYSHNYADATRAHGALNRRYKDELIRYYGTVPEFVVMRIRRDAILEQRLPQPDGKPALPACLIQRANERDPDRCMRIRVAESYRVLGRDTPQEPTERDRSLRETIGARAEGFERDISIFDPEPPADETANRAGEPISFAPIPFLASSDEIRLVDAFVTHGDTEIYGGMTGLRPVGGSVVACGEDRQYPAIIPDNRAAEELSRNPRGAVGPDETLSHLESIDDKFRQGVANTASITLDSILKQPALIGRGLGNIFEMRIENIEVLPEEVYFILVYLRLKCSRDDGALIEIVEPFESDIEQLRDALLDDGAFLAEGLVRLEAALATNQAAAEARDKLASPSPVAEADARDWADAKRLAALESLADVLALTTVAETEDDRLALAALERGWSAMAGRLAATLPSAEGPSWADRIGDLVEAETGFGAVSPESLDDETARGGSEILRPPSLAAYEQIAVLALFGGTTSRLVGETTSPLGGRVSEDTRTTLAETKALVQGIDDVLAFHDRQVLLERTLEHLLDLGDRRLDFAKHLAQQLNVQYNKVKPYAALSQMLCLGWTLEQKDFWLAQSADARHADLERLKRFAEEAYLPSIVAKSVESLDDSWIEAACLAALTATEPAAE